MLEPIIGSLTNDVILINLVISTISSLLLGLAVSWIYRFKNNFSQSLAVTLVLLPAVVHIIIMLVDGNIGVGVAVSGAFSLIRFRSVPGNSRDIGHLFFAMALGFVTGMGFLFYSFVLLLLVGAASLLLTVSGFGKSAQDIRILRIRIPENLDYEGLFDEVFAEYTISTELESVKTTQMGSLFELTYSVHLKSQTLPKAFIDELRIRNGNLNITLSREMRNRDEL